MNSSFIPTCLRDIVQQNASITPVAKAQHHLNRQRLAPPAALKVTYQIVVKRSCFFVTLTTGSSSDVSLLQDDAVLCKEQICGSSSNGKSCVALCV